jgi:hypothetical protein
LLGKQHLHLLLVVLRLGDRDGGWIASFRGLGLVARKRCADRCHSSVADLAFHASHRIGRRGKGRDGGRRRSKSPCPNVP